jgi:hypothetical protein
VESSTSDGELPPELANLAGAAAAADGAAAPAPDDQAHGAPAAPTLSNRDAIAAGIELFRELVCAVMRVESPKATLSPDVAQRIGQAWEPVCAKYGIDLGAMFGRFGPEIAAAAITAPLVLAAYRALDAELRDKRTAKLPEASNDQAKPEAAPPPPPPKIDAAALDRALRTPFDAPARKPWDPDLAARNAGVTPAP